MLKMRNVNTGEIAYFDEKELSSNDYNIRWNLHKYKVCKKREHYVDWEEIECAE